MARSPSKHTQKKSYSPPVKRFESSPPPINPKRTSGSRPISLPFEKKNRQRSWSQWIFKHRVGLMVTVVIYLSMAILFVSYKIVVRPVADNSIDIEFEQEEQVITEEQKLERELYAQDEPVKNRISSDDSRFDETLRDSKNTDAAEIYREAERIQEELRAGQASYEQALLDIEQRKDNKDEQPRSNIDAKEGARNQDAFVEGNVVASFDLEGRTAYYFDIPAYKCEDGGTVVVNISVNANGKVVAASVDRAQSSTNRCLNNEAVASAKACRFSPSTTAPNPQKGTITYTFVAQ